MFRSTGVGTEALRAGRTHVGLVTTARVAMTGERPLIRELFLTLVAKIRRGGGLRHRRGGLCDDLPELLTIVLHLGLVASCLAVEMTMQVRLARGSVRAKRTLEHGLVFGS